MSGNDVRRYPVSRLKQKAILLVEWLEAKLGVGHADIELAASFRAKQVHAVLSVTPLTLFANCFNVIVISYTYWATANRWFLCGWSLLIMGASAVGVPAWLRWRDQRSFDKLSAFFTLRAIRNAVLLAVLWALFPIGLFADSSESQRLLLVSIVTGMICAGGFALATIPLAAIAYVIVLTLGAAWAIQGQYPAIDLMLFTYALIVVAAVLATAKSFGARLSAEHEAARQSELVGILLNDFEEGASDWLWETDEACKLKAVPHRIADIISEEEAADSFVDVLGLRSSSQEVEDRAGVEMLVRCFQDRLAFRHVVIPIANHSEVRWWSLSARPLYDNHRRFKGWRGVGSDVTAEQLSNQKLNKLANIDALTGLSNRHHFNAELERLMREVDSHACALYFIDLDNFKYVNDCYGHQVGDQLISAIASRLRACVHREDILSRLGGDEFALICQGIATAEHASKMANRLLNVFREPCGVSGSIIQTSASIGIAMAPSDATTQEDLLKYADMALYEAKSQGRNRFALYDSQLEYRMRAHASIHAGLMEALENEQFVLHFQPQVSLQSGRLLGFEALVRWQRSETELLAPAHFISIAEETGLIIPLGEWVLARACRVAASWPGELSIAVNIAASHFRKSADLTSTIDRILRETGLPAPRLELEVTESLLLEDDSEALDILRELKGRGVRIAIDDFGTGYSSLSYLRKYPINKLKIDRAFVSQIEGDTVSRAVVRAIIELAHALGLETTAEGVEEVQQHQILMALGCNQSQGFYIARPMPEHEAAALISAADYGAFPR